MANAVEQLIVAMQDELQGHKKLSAVLDNKLDAMRHFDVSRLESLRQSEQRLLDSVRMIGQRRMEALNRAAVQLYPQQRARFMTAKELAAAAAEPERCKLLTLAAMLKEVAENIQRLNRINAVATKKVLGHFDHIFNIIAQSGRDIGLYGRAGKKSIMEQNRLVDAIA
ncbi:MAG: flagellar protein FlgN [Planctomycetes bacterium]|nr:flagellar protein FlgN [Planctomycetota bacterium]